MKQKLTTAIVALLGVLTMAFTFTNQNPNETLLPPDPLPPKAKTYAVSAASSKITWKGYKVTGQHAGTINLQNGALQFDGDKLVGGSFEIDMRSIKCTDLEGDYAKKLEGHLKSKDFFGVSNYPTAGFKITKVISRGKPGDYKIVGNLTIKKTTKQIKFLAHVTDNKTATAQLKIDRSDFDVRYGSGSFFDALGDKTIYDEFDLNIKLATN